MEMTDICEGADPFIYKQHDTWHLLIQSDFRCEPHDHDGIKGYSVRSAKRISDLWSSEPVALTVSSQSENLRQVWAGEIHHTNHLYVSASTGDNATHRMHVYKTLGTAQGPWEHLGQLKTVASEDGWMIDLTFADITVNRETKTYAFWSGWDTTPLSTSDTTEVIPQHIYVAECISETEIGQRYLIATPKEEWSCSVASILEGPQALYIENDFKGLLLACNASWTTSYNTSILKYLGGNPLHESSWKMVENPLFTLQKGIGHGMIAEEEKELYFVGHYKTQEKFGWHDRKVFYTKLTTEEIENLLQ